MKPRYADEHVTLYCADMVDVLAGMRDESVDAVITDPPYTERTHAGARSNWKSTRRDGAVVTAPLQAGSDRQFAAVADDELRGYLTECGRVSRGWVVAHLDYRQAVAFDVDPPEGLRMMRIGVWVKTAPMPQLTGDRPAQGWEAIAYLHRDDRRSVWNGGGKAGNYVHAAARENGRNSPNGHPTEKPIEIAADLVRKFTTTGDVVLDPFAGSGTTLRAAVNEGRRAIGVELDPTHCATIVRRMGQTVLF
ncbi:DNA methylase [Gordonia phage JKSyngboy]|uniref:DNA methylase n=1 Tax=Gordonia phage JKSyngboy TaxID=2762400 RepID=A0A7G8LLD4_9CAUD|nr:DNA methyltransferase [Gordonia phage JKSyngboy]QNJ58056.1 DNA methylase [Gordonia phage JKSyngboy]